MALRPNLVLPLLVLLALPSCSQPPQRALPPSASDVPLMKSTRLCDDKERVLARHRTDPVERRVWGSGEELRLAGPFPGSERSFFFDEDGRLVGALFVFPRALALKPYPVLRQTLGQLRPSVEFYLRLGSGGERAGADAVALYETGDVKTTAQYLVLTGRQPSLLMASFALDPYVKLLSPYRQDLLARLDSGAGSAVTSKGADDKERFAALQQFARGEAAHFASCGSRDDHLAADAYAKALELGFSDAVWQAEAHYKLGLALHGVGRLEDAKAALERSLTARPNHPEVYNSLGAVLADLGDRSKAVEMFERAVVLRPNYAIARFNLAKAYEEIDVRRAIAEYETFVALVDGIPEEEPRRLLAKQRIAALRR